MLSTTTFAPFAHSRSSRYFAVVSEDEAGNRRAPLFLETDVGKIDLIVIVDDSGSVNSYHLAAAAAGHTSILQRMEDQDRFGLIGLGSSEPSMPLTLLDSAARATAATVIAGHTSSGGATPMDTGILWALDQFARPEIANDGRPHMIVVFSDGEWILDTNIADILKATHPTIFAVATPFTFAPSMPNLQDITNTPLPGTSSAAIPESRFLDGPDIAANYQTIASSLHSQLSNVDARTIWVTQHPPIQISNRFNSAATPSHIHSRSTPQPR